MIFRLIAQYFRYRREFKCPNRSAEPIKSPLCVHTGRRCVRSLSTFGIARPRRRVHRRPAGPTSAPSVGQLGQSALSLPFLCPLRSEVVANTKDGDKTDQESGETHGLINPDVEEEDKHIYLLVSKSNAVQGTLTGIRPFQCSTHIMCSVKILTTITSNIDLPLDRYVILNIPAAGERTSRAASGQGVGVVCVESSRRYRCVRLWRWRCFWVGLARDFNDEKRGEGKEHKGEM